MSFKNPISELGFNDASKENGKTLRQGEYRGKKEETRAEERK